MANLKEIRNRITSVSSTMQITSAMKMVSAAKLKKHKMQYASLCRKINGTITKLSATLEGDVGGEYTQREVKKY
jgi:F-type H+-transporting ATPase subunit gamma